MLPPGTMPSSGLTLRMAEPLDDSGHVDDQGRELRVLVLEPDDNMQQQLFCLSHGKNTRPGLYPLIH